MHRLYVAMTVNSYLWNKHISVNIVCFNYYCC